jgi:uncharacterized membrane protein YeaQ/YmgE (transglycosylase-associated protein family)
MSAFSLVFPASALSDPRPEFHHEFGGCVGFVFAGVVGLIGGFAARYIMPGPNPLGQGGAIGLGMAGAVAGYVAGALLGGGLLGVDTRGVILAIIGTLLMLLSYRSYALRYGT